MGRKRKRKKMGDEKNEEGKDVGDRGEERGEIEVEMRSGRERGGKEN